MAVENLGPLDWRIPIVTEEGRPTAEFQRRWATQVGNNSQIGSITLGSGPPPASPAPADGAQYADTSTNPYTMYIGDGGVWNLAGTVGANPTATAGDVAVNGSATTFMRSDGAPAVQKASSSQFGIVKVDGTTITETGGVISSSGGGSGRPPEGTYQKPLVASYTWVNQGTATATDGAQSLVMNVPTSGSNSLRILQTTPPATPYNAYCRFDAVSQSTSGGYGITLRNSTSGRLLSGLIQPSAQLTINRWSSPTVFNANPVTVNDIDKPPRWARIHNDGTTMTFYVSFDGLDWFTVGTELLATYVNAAGGSVDGVGFVSNANGNHFVFFRSFGFTTPTYP